MRTPKQAYDEAIQIIEQRKLNPRVSEATDVGSYQLGLAVAIEQLKLSFHGVFEEVASTHIQAVPPEAGDGLLTPEQRADVIKACNGPKGIPFGPHFTCSQCGAKVHDDIVQDGAGNVWCPTCVERQLKAQQAYRVGQPHPSPASRPEEFWVCPLCNHGAPCICPPGTYSQD